MAIFLAVVAALVSWGLWAGEVLLVKGWSGIAWTSGFSWSLIPISIIIASVSSWIVQPAASRRRGFFVGSMGGTLLAVVTLLRQGLMEAFSGGISRGALYWLIGTALLAEVLVPSATVVAARWTLRPLRPGTGVLMGLAMVVVIPLSLATIHVLPALNGATDDVHAFKMGYPVFWGALAIMLAVVWGARRQ